MPTNTTDADTTVRIRNCDTPLDFADSEELKKLLIAHGAVPGERE